MTEEGSSNSDFNKETPHENEIKNLKQIIDEKIKENNKEIINHLEIKFENKYGNEISLLNQKIVELTFKMEQKNNLSVVNFVQIKNKWSKITHECCDDVCINTFEPIGDCIEGNGFINIIDDATIKYINCVGEGENKAAGITAENKFNKPKNDCINYSLFYFEIKCKIEGVKSVKNWMAIGLWNGNNGIRLDIDGASVGYISINKNIKFKIPKFFWNDGDVFGFGLVYPSKMNELPYAFFTQNGKLIGKSLLLKHDDCDNYEIFAHLKRCSIVANFGNDLTAKPFIYNISEHLAPKEFYVDSDGSIKMDTDDSISTDSSVMTDSDYSISSYDGSISSLSLVIPQ
uniref:Uncharacterized protein n=1 Tax=Meloidogyne enterolobii TaxID=390850 RepID=A0A6V7TZP3_MELEN|nr:unnamed protein product [Meloidogyne enterolobii]